jgi:DNA processing protein
MRLTDEQREWLALSLVPGVGTAYFIRLLARFRSPGAVLRASQGALREVVGPKLAERIAQYTDVVDVEGQERLMAEYDATLITLNDTRYPLLLGEIYDPPLALFVRGELKEEDATTVAIVGTRRATPYGIRMAEKLGRELGARGVTVISGMASGIDSAAHRGAIDGGGRTIAVLGNGVDIVYPPQNAELMDAITRNGCVLSQFPMGMKPSKGHFPYRNRIISGMTKGTVVVQAPARSGALITANTAAEQGREVFAVPGEVGVRNSEGPHALIREGAKLVETVEDILLELNLPVEVRASAMRAKSTSEAPTPSTSVHPRTAQPAPAPVAKKAVGIEGDVLSVLSPNGSFVDEIAAACRVSVSEALSTLTILELKGLIRQFSGKRFAPR